MFKVRMFSAKLNKKAKFVREFTAKNEVDLNVQIEKYANHERFVKGAWEITTVAVRVS